MGVNPACNTYLPMLSPFIDGELPPGERVVVERHLQACRDCTSRVADLRAESGLVRVGMEMLADEVDFKDFANKVMAGLTPHKAPLFERLRLSLSEMFLYQRGQLFTALAGAAAMLLIALPLMLREGNPTGYGGKRLEVQTVSVDTDAKVAPVLMETDSGDTIIWMVDTDEKGGAEGDEDKDDESREEELGLDRQNGGKLKPGESPRGGEL